MSKNRNRSGEQDVLKTPNAASYPRKNDIEIGVENHAPSAKNRRSNVEFSKEKDVIETEE